MYNSSGHSSSGHSWAVRCVSFSPDGKTIVSGSDDKTIKIWNVETGDVAEETQDLAVKVDETAMLRAEIAKKGELLKRDEELEKRDEELPKKDEESAAMHAMQTMEIANLKEALQKERMEIERQRVEIANLKQALSESCSTTAVDPSISRRSIDTNKLKKEVKEAILKAWTAIQDK